ncbi:M24 family metallopeptidase [Bhargavaea cecembensis]|uniref:M24 family metallopeptidase n=1 Tax=Bhargavaea cecembensis TaxID=394098 RepID=UPI000590CDC2|nr:Xaa-Pro peptidase family protein [Bhargavaea cecembensis]
METIYSTRRGKFREQLRSEGVQSALITSPANVFYFTGFLSDPHERFMGLLIGAEGEPEILFVPALDLSAAEEASDVRNLIPISDDEQPFEKLKESAGPLAGKIGIEGSVLSYDRFKRLSGQYPELSVQDVGPLVSRLRLYKSADEISKMRTAIRLIEEVMEGGAQKARIGMTEAELTAELEYLMRKVGADGPSFSTMVLAGEKAALPHGNPGDRKFREGDVVLIDMGVIKDGYCSDITRTFLIGEPTDEQRKIYDIVLRSTLAGIDAARAGATFADIDRASRDVIADAGYGQYFNNRVGHGIGIEVHEGPSVHGRNEDKAAPGQVFTVEPGIYIPGRLGIRIEDMVHINENGEAEVLTSFPRELRIIG